MHMVHALYCMRLGALSAVTTVNAAAAFVAARANPSQGVGTKPPVSRRRDSGVGGKAFCLGLAVIRFSTLRPPGRGV